MVGQKSRPYNPKPSTFTEPFRLDLVRLNWEQGSPAGLEHYSCMPRRVIAPARVGHKVYTLSCVGIWKGYAKIYFKNQVIPMGIYKIFHQINCNWSYEYRLWTSLSSLII